MTQAVEMSYATGDEPAVLIPKYADLPGYVFTKSPMGDTQLAQTPEGCLRKRELSPPPHTHTHKGYTYSSSAEYSLGF